MKGKKIFNSLAPFPYRLSNLAPIFANTKALLYHYFICNFYYTNIVVLMNFPE